MERAVIQPRPPGGTVRRVLLCLAAASIALAQVVPAAGHTRFRRISLDGLIQRTDLIVRGRIIADTTDTYPRITRLEVKAVLKGAYKSKEITFSASGQMAHRYVFGQHALVFLKREGEKFTALERTGNPYYVRPGAERDYDAYVSAVKARGRAPTTMGDENYRKVVFAGLNTKVPELRSHLFAKLISYLSRSSPLPGERARLLGLIRSPAQPVKARLAFLGVLRRHMTTAELTILFGELAEKAPPNLLAGLLTTLAKRHRVQYGHVRDGTGGGKAAAGLKKRIRPYLQHRNRGLAFAAARSLAILGDAMGRPVLLQRLKGKNIFQKIDAVRALGLLSQAGDRSSYRILASARGKLGNMRAEREARRWLKLAQAANPSMNPLLWLLIAVLGATAFLSVILWLRRRRPLPIDPP